MLTMLFRVVAMLVIAAIKREHTNVSKKRLDATIVAALPGWFVANANQSDGKFDLYPVVAWRVSGDGMNNGGYAVPILYNSLGIFDKGWWAIKRPDDKFDILEDIGSSNLIKHVGEEESRALEFMIARQNELPR